VPQSVLEMAKDLVMAQIQAGRFTPDTVQDALQKTYTSLMALKAQEEADGSAAVETSPPASPDWRKSITRNVITCLECGASYKQLTRHLREHGLDGRSYRAKYGIPQKQALAARATTARRRKIMQETKPWEKAPRYQQAQQEKAESATATKTSRTRRTRTARAKG
jgi:predicted transcriptional regulator